MVRGCGPRLSQRAVLSFLMYLNLRDSYLPPRINATNIFVYFLSIFLMCNFYKIEVILISGTIHGVGEEQVVVFCIDTC